MSDPIKRNDLNLIRPTRSGPACEAELLLEKLLESGLISPLAFDALPETARAELAHYAHAPQFLARLVDFELLTSYQADRVRIGNVHGLILGNYRVLDRLGVGNHGVVFRGEHRETGQKVAIKVLIPPRDLDTKPMLRFFAERKTVAQLCHPGIVRALDVGETTSDDPDEPVLYYYVMELVPGLDLEQHVQKNGPMQPSLACDVAYQVSDALDNAHQHNLVHRDIKPSNILLTPDGRAMLLDFGLVRQIHSRQTEMGSIVGMLEWIAPEQARDPRAVDIRADIYSLGCTLFWCLTAHSPNAMNGSLGAGLAQLQKVPPATVRAIRSEISPDLDAIVARMMAPLPDDRYPTPQAAMAALAALVSEKYAVAAQISQPCAGPASPPAPTIVPSTTRVLIVDDDPVVRRVCCEALQADGIACDESGDGELALQAVVAASPDLVLLAIDLPGMAGLEVLKQLRQGPQGADRRIIMLIGSGCDIRPLLAAGADDYLTKPIDGVLLRSRVKTALQFKETQIAPRQQPAPLAPQSEAKIEDRPEEPTTPNFWQPAVNWLLGRKKHTPAVNFAASSEAATPSSSGGSGQ
jgi:CheY-like chemotaxis protein